jgi:hypothetical protein
MPRTRSSAAVVLRARLNAGTASSALIASGTLMSGLGDSIDTGAAFDILLENTGHNIYVPVGYKQQVPGTDVINTADCYWPTQSDRVTGLSPVPGLRFIGAEENEISKGTSSTLITPALDSLFAAQTAHGETILKRRKLKTWGETNSTKIANAAAVDGHCLGLEGPRFINLDKNLLYDHTDTNNYIDPPGGTNNHPSSNVGCFKEADAEFADLQPHLATTAWIIPTGGAADPNNLNPNGNHSGSVAATGTNQSGTVGTNESTSASTLTSIPVVWSKVTMKSGNAGVAATVSGTPSADQYASWSVNFPNTTIFPTENGQQIYYDTLVEVEHYAADGVSAPAGLYSVVINASAHPGSASAGDVWDRASDAYKRLQSCPPRRG